jgi:hypothetical protein
LLFPLQVLAEGLPSLAIVDFTSTVETKLVQILPDLLSDKLVDAELFEVVDREKLNTAMTEIGFSGSGAIDDKAIQAGKMVGAQYLLTGKILELSKSQKEFKGYGTQFKTATVRLAISADVIETGTSRKLFSRRASTAKEFQEMGGLTISAQTAGEEMANQVADKLVTAMLGSNRLRALSKTDEASAETDPATPKEALITITSSPKDASVEIDNVLYGNTGETFKVPSGLHTITVGLDEHQVWEKKVMVKDGMKLHIPLSKNNAATR